MMASWPTILGDDSVAEVTICLARWPLHYRRLVGRYRDHVGVYSRIMRRYSLKKKSDSIS